MGKGRTEGEGHSQVKRAEDEKHIPTSPTKNTQKKGTSMETMGNDINIDDQLSL